jgi:hypothetical protein
MRNAERRPIREEDRAKAGPNGTPVRPASMGTQAEQTYWTAREWGRRTRVPYRSILAATAKGELSAIRPSGTNHGTILISEDSWERWLVQIELKRRVPPTLSTRPGRHISDFALS